MSLSLMTRAKNRLLALLSEPFPPSLFSVTVVDNGSDSPLTFRRPPFHCRLMLCSKHGSYAAEMVWPNTQAPWVAYRFDWLPEITWLETGLQATRVW